MQEFSADNLEFRLYDLSCSLFSFTFHELRAIRATINKELFEIFFYIDDAIEEERADACRCIITHVWDPDIDEEIQEHIIRLDECFSIPSTGKLIYKRREPFWRYLESRTSSEKENNFVLIAKNEILTPLELRTCRLCFFEVLLNKITPNLREISTAWSNNEFFLFLIFDGEICNEDQRLARIIAQEAQDKILGYVFFVSLIRLDFPQRIKDDIYEILIPNYNGTIKQETHFSRWENYVKDFVED